MTRREVAYRPSLAAQCAAWGLPALRTALPDSVYRKLYEWMYCAYRAADRWLYGLGVLGGWLFADAARRERAKLTFKLLPFTMGGSRALENAYDVVALAELRAIPGALVECGVARGGTAAMMALTNLLRGAVPRHSWLFDSYEGLPEPTVDDYDGERTGVFIRALDKGSCLGTIDEVESLLFSILGLEAMRTHLVKGWFHETVPKWRYMVGDIAVLRLDGDWYESTKVPLTNLYGQVSVGGFVIIDDYATCFGSRRAVDEFRAERGISAPLVADGRGGVWFEKVTASYE